MDQSFAKLRERTERIISQSTRPDKQLVLAELLEVWRGLEKRGVGAFDFALVAVLVAECTVQSYDSLDAFQDFGEHLKESGSSIIRCVSNHWPLVDPKDWPDAPPEWLQDER